MSARATTAVLGIAFFTLGWVAVRHSLAGEPSGHTEEDHLEQRRTEEETFREMMANMPPWLREAEERKNRWLPVWPEVQRDAAQFWEDCHEAELEQAEFDTIVADLHQRVDVAEALHAAAREGRLASDVAVEVAETASLEAQFRMQAFLEGAARVSGLSGVPTRLADRIFESFDGPASEATQDGWLFSSVLVPDAECLLVFRIEEHRYPDLFYLKQMLIERRDSAAAVN